MDYASTVNWREEFNYVAKGYNANCYSPMRGKEFLKGEKSVGDTYEQFPMASEQGIFGRDTFDIRRSDIVLANFLGSEKVSIGTVAEIAMAWTLGKYVLVVMEKGNVHDHAFIRRMASVVVRDLEDAHDVLSILNAGV